MDGLSRRCQGDVAETMRKRPGKAAFDSPPAINHHDVEVPKGDFILNRRFWRGAVASLVALACLAGARAECVLCVGVDGHVEIEQAHHSDCADANHTPRETGLGLPPVNHCGPCVDIPLGNGLADRAYFSRGAHALDGAAPIAHTRPILETSLTGGAVRVRFFHQSSPADPGILALRI